MNADRDPINQFALGAAARAWIDNLDPETRDETFEKALLDQGVISPAEAIASLAVDGSGVWVDVVLDSGERLSIGRLGHVVTFE